MRHFSTFKRHAALVCDVAEKCKPTGVVIALGHFNLLQVNWCYSDTSYIESPVQHLIKLLSFLMNYFIAIYLNTTVIPS